MFLSCHFFAFYTGYIILWQVVAKQCWHVDKSMQVTLWLDAVNTTNVYEWEIGLRDVTKRLAPPTGDILQRVRVRHDNIDKSLATRLPSCRTFIVDTLDFQLNPVFEKSKAGKKKKKMKSKNFRNQSIPRQVCFPQHCKLTREKPSIASLSLNITLTAIHTKLACNSQSL